MYRVPVLSGCNTSYGLWSHEVWGQFCNQWAHIWKTKIASFSVSSWSFNFLWKSFLQHPWKFLDCGSDVFWYITRQIPHSHADSSMSSCWKCTSSFLIDEHRIGLTDTSWVEMVIRILYPEILTTNRWSSTLQYRISSARVTISHSTIFLRFPLLCCSMIDSRFVPDRPCSPMSSCRRRLLNAAYFPPLFRRNQK